DTFLMREQITIKSLRDSRLCVVVLSASQALSSVDMGLIRLISTLKSKGIVIFVNRIDELSDPASQLPDIRNSILTTFERLNGPKDPAIVFGSAYWANMALGGGFGAMARDSADTLRAFAAVTPGLQGADPTRRDVIWQMSGMPELMECLSERIAEDTGTRFLAHIRKRARNIVSGLRATTSVASMRLDGNAIDVMAPGPLAALLDQIEAEAHQRLNAELDRVFNAFAARVDQSHARFLDRALESLLQHLEQKGEDQVWKYSPDGLRMLLRTSHQVLRKNLGSTCLAVYGATADRLAQAYRQAVAVEVDGFTVTPPGPVEVPAPVSLGATIVLDLQTSLWQSWWRKRRGYRAYASGFHDLIAAETAPIISELKDRQAAEIRQAAIARMTDFLAEQRTILMDFVDKAHLSMHDLRSLFGISSQAERAGMLDLLYDELSWAEDSDIEAEELTTREGTAA
ncbi:MAG: hypothetical protein WAK98_00585, partial [Gemmobacter sp.]